jgi:thiamine-phosphate pyrophosphorylase
VTPAPRLILITDPSFGDETIVRCVRGAALALPPGALAVQLRDKRRLRPSLRSFAVQLRCVTRSVGAWLIVNGDSIVARDAGADGVHLPSATDPAARIQEARASFGRSTWISIAAHSDEDVARAAAAGADAVLVSPVMATRAPGAGSPEKSPRGLAAIRRARALAPPGLLIYALGGVTAATAGACAASGAFGVAVIRALLSSAQPGHAALAIHDAVIRR